MCGAPTWTPHSSDAQQGTHEQARLLWEKADSVRNWFHQRTLDLGTSRIVNILAGVHLHSDLPP
eukprot:6006674-Heterocapsa_arctica.AAC.1